MIPTAIGQYKLVLVGDSAVGKSSLLSQFVDGKFDDKLLSTIGVDFKFRRVKIENQQIKLQIWDTAGQQTFRSIVSAYYNSADGIILCYDVSSYQSYESLKDYWLPEAENNNKTNAKIFIVGNKIDCKKQVQQFSLQTIKDGHKIEKFYEVSAKQNINVENTFTDIARILHKNNETLPGNFPKTQSKAGGTKLTLTAPSNTGEQVVGPNKKPCCQK